MLKLKKLQILGFKSFCDRTELKFHGDGIAAIIGPNGCGKSNISDAISWVLGEQSAKTLRGARMEDVIFAGTRDRKPTGMAEVSLTLVDPAIYDGAPIENPEIDIQEKLPEDFGDWNEAEVRAHAAAETERLTAESQPGRIEDGDHRTGDFQADSAESAGELAAAEKPEVTLKIRRRKFQQQSRAGEIAVTRRLFRSGDSEYLLNGKLCRLRDIQELFMGTGLGPESYALIEQGRIGQILSSRPTDRRAILEEAAGITKFKTKKRLAEARLEDAKQNLSRINDIFDEVTRQMNSLKRQAAKAERYAKLRDEMRTQLRVVLASKFVQLDRERGLLESQLSTLSDELHAKTEAVQKLEAEHGLGTQRSYAIQSGMQENRDQLNQLKLESDRAMAQLHYNEERSTELTRMTAAADAELIQDRDRLANLELEFAAQREMLSSLDGELADAQAQLSEAQLAVSMANKSVKSVEDEQEEWRRAILEAAGKESALRNQLTQAEERLASLDRDTQRITAELISSRSQVDAFGGQRGQLSIEFESGSNKIAALAEEIDRTRLLIAEKREAENSSKNHLDSLRAEFATAQGKRASLELMISEHGYSTDSVKRLFQSGVMNGGLAPVGVLADFLEVESQYEGVVEDFLRDELNYVVVKSWDAANEGLRLLRTDVDGRATFLVHPEDSQAKFSFLIDEATRPAPPSHSIVPLTQTMRVLDGFGKSLEVILPKLRDGYIVPDVASGRDLALRNPDAFFLSPSGECFHNVTVTGGKQRSEGPLSMKRELRDLIRAMNGLEEALRHEEQKVLMLARELKTLATLLERLEVDKREAEKAMMTSDHLLKQLDSEISRIAGRADTCQRDISRLETERITHQQSISSRTIELSVLFERRSDLEVSVLQLAERVAALREERDVAAQNASERRAATAILEERRRAGASGLQRLEWMTNESKQRISSLSAKIESAAAEQSQRRVHNDAIHAQLVDLEAARNAGAARDGLLQFESDALRIRLTEIEQTLREARQLLDAARERRSEVSIAIARLLSDSDHMAQTCLNDLGVEGETLKTDPNITLVVGEELTAADLAYREMNSRLDAMGPVNMMALDEYKEIYDRHGFLETQRKDLLEAIQNTHSTIREIDVFTKEKFDEAFQKINQNFSATFQKLFGGGHAFMRLTDEENSADSGIDVVASPPGKKLQNVLLLSGGEKALTALALLVGIFQYQPSPFCILDEVDAPLDEANIGRFTELVRDMSLKTQFVLITHSKKTMSIAPVLYGVTMQEPGVSKLVSVRFGSVA